MDVPASLRLEVLNFDGGVLGTFSFDQIVIPANGRVT